jgi:hypothetical protein
LLLRLTVMSANDGEACARKDLSGRAGSFLTVWIAPIVLAGALSLADLSGLMSAAAWTIAFAWMGAACLVNARRCGRLHCFFSGPILLAGAILTGFAALGVVRVEPWAMAAIVTAALCLAALTFGLELIWGRYRR